MIWKDYLKLSETVSYSKLVRASKAPPPPPGGIGLSQLTMQNPYNNHPFVNLQNQKWMVLFVLTFDHFGQGCCNTIIFLFSVTKKNPKWHQMKKNPTMVDFQTQQKLLFTTQALPIGISLLPFIKNKNFFFLRQNNEQKLYCTHQQMYCNKVCNSFHKLLTEPQIIKS